MKRPVLILILLASTACAPPRETATVRRVERADTFRAVLAENLTVCLDDVMIVPPDTLRHPRLKAARMELHRTATAGVEARADVREHETARKQTAAPAAAWRPPVWVLLAAAAAAYIAGAWRRRGEG